MPIVPEQPKLLSTDVPGAAIEPSRAMGQTGAAIESVGNQLENEGFSLIGKMKAAQAESASSTALAQGMLDTQDDYAEIKTASKDGYAVDDDGNPMTNPDGSRRTITDELKDRLNERFQNDQLTMPSQLAQQMYQQKARAYYTEQIMHMGNDENILAAQDSKASDANIAQGFADRLVSNADVGTAYQFSNTLSSSIMGKAGTIYEHPEAQTEVQKYNGQLAESVMKGAYNQVLSDARSGQANFNRSDEVAQWRSVLSGDDAVSQQRKKQGLPIISDMLNPDKKAALDEEFIKLGTSAHEMDMSDFRTQIKDSVAALQMGNSGRVDVPSQFSQIDQMVARGKLQPTEGADFKSQIAAAQSIGLINTSAFALMSPTQQAQIVESQAKRVYGTAQEAGGGASAGSSAEAAFRSQAATVLQQNQSAKQKDFPAFVESVDPSVATSMSGLNFTVPQTLQDKGTQIQAAIAKTQLYYDHNFPGQSQNAKVITQDRAAQVAKALSDPNMNQQQTADSVKALSQAYGPYYPALMHQLVTQQHLDKRWEMAAFFPGASTEDAVSAIKGGTADNKNFETLAASKEVTDKQFKTAVAQKVSPWITTFVNQNPGDPQNSQRAEAIQSVVTDRAKQIYTQGNGNTSKDEAADLAVSSMLGKNASIEESKPGWFGSGRSFTYMIPNSDGSRSIGEPEKAQIRQFVTDKNTGDGLKSLGVVGPPNSAPTFHDDIAKTGRFSLSPNMQGYNYFYVDPMAQREVPARVPDGRGGVKPLFIPLSQMMAPTTPGKSAPKTYGQGG